MTARAQARIEFHSSLLLRTEHRAEIDRVRTNLPAACRYVQTHPSESTRTLVCWPDGRARPRAGNPRTLLDAAAQQFAERGIHETSLGDIAAAAGVTRQGLCTTSRPKPTLCLPSCDSAIATTSKPYHAPRSRPATSKRLCSRSSTTTARTPDSPACSPARSPTAYPTSTPPTSTSTPATGAAAAPSPKSSGAARSRASQLRRDPEALAGAVLALISGLNLHQQLDPETDHSAALEAILSLLLEPQPAKLD